MPCLSTNPIGAVAASTRTRPPATLSAAMASLSMLRELAPMKPSRMIQQSCERAECAADSLE